MFYTQWDCELAIGIADIDQCHKYIVKMINEAYDGFVLGINTDDYIVEDVLVYMNQCFDFEEVLMMETSYPGLLEHRDEHELFRQKILEAGCGGGNDPNSTIRLLILLNSWINRHIRGCDSQLGVFVKTLEQERKSCKSAYEH